jgi:hypothetical protein
MDDILKIITEKALGSESAAWPVFVFPSENSASLWAAKTLTLLPERGEQGRGGGYSVTIPQNRFIAWDEFKEAIIQNKKKERRAANKITRLLFAHYIINKNAKEKKPFLSYLIPDAYARDGKIFANIITEMLPAIKLWSAKTADIHRSIDENIFGTEYQFLQELEKQYSEFLNRTGYYEPSWENLSLYGTNNEYYIFYPSLINDFFEYGELLKEAISGGTIHIIRVTDGDDSSTLSLYDTTREELRALVSRIRRLYYEEHIPYEDIFISVAELDTLEPYIKRELSLYNIPYHLRSGKPLAEYAGGRLFAQINDCVENNFSFETLRALLFNYALPWKTQNKNFALVRFGIKNNCVQGYRENGIFRDVWEEAFRQGRKKRRLYLHYKKLKKYCAAFGVAKDFAALSAAGEQFIKKFFHQDEDPVIGRIIQVLYSTQNLINEITVLYPAAAPAKPLELFIAVLKEETHVNDEKKTGVQIFKYGVAASAPSRAHFIINTNQKSTTKLYRPLAWLREDSRRALKLNDIDVSKDFFKCYNIKSSTGEEKHHVYFSAASLTFSGWNIAHSYFDRQRIGDDTCIIKEKPPSGDLFIEEKTWWASGALQDCFFNKKINSSIFKIQKEGFLNWRRQEGVGAFNLLVSPFEKTTRTARELQSGIIALKYAEGKLRVSATALKKFFTCQSFWLFNDIFKIEETGLCAVLLDDTGKGLLYHEILKVVFMMIKYEENEGRFNKKNIKKYRVWTESAAEEITKNYPAFRGPLVRSLLEAISDSLAQKIKKLFETEGDNFDGWYVGELEKEFSLAIDDDIILHGFIDRVSLPPDKQRALIIDYKTSAAPTRSQSTENTGSPLSDFQIACYIKLYEQNTGIKTGRAAFFRINSAEIKKIVWEEYEWRGDDYSRDAYQPSIQALDDFILYYAKTIENLDFSPKEVRCGSDSLKPEFSAKAVVPFKVCVTCIYKDICRTTFSLKADAE